MLTFVSRFFDNPAHPSLSLERVQQARSDNVWSARVSRSLRAILSKDGDDCVLVYVDQHDDAYSRLPATALRDTSVRRTADR